MGDGTFSYQRVVKSPSYIKIQNGSNMRTRSKIFYWYAAFVIAYTCLTLLPYPDHTTLHRYHLTVTSLRLLDITIILPLIFIWFAAFYGYYKLHAYALAIKRGKDGSAVRKLSYGLLALTIGLPVSSIISAILKLVALHHPSFTATAAIITNYVEAAYPLIGFLFISAGARKLSEIAKTRPSLKVLNILALAIIIIGVGFCSLIAAGHRDVYNTFHMAPALVMLTLAVPYIYVWFLGALAAIEIYLYSRCVAGVVYRRSWNTLAAGLTAIIATEIVLQYLGTLSSWITKLSLSNILVLLYVLLLLLAGAYIVVALGTKKLIRIEEA